MFVNGVIQRKLTLLDESVSRLERHLNGVTVDAFKADELLQFQQLYTRLLSTTDPTFVVSVMRLTGHADLFWFCSD